MRFSFPFRSFLTVLAVLFLLPQNTFAQRPVKLNANTFGAIEARHIGPATMSGRITSLDADPSDSRILYVGAASGGVWKSINAGTTFKPVFDDHPQSIGALTLDPNHPDTVWVGTGEPWTRNSTSVGKGVYLSTDGGEKWEEVGLTESERIAEILIDAEDPATVFVAALGPLWGDGEQRGLFRTTDFGKSWEKVLYVDETTGATSLIQHPEDPELLYAAMWDFRRTPASFRSGGPGSGLYRSRDGGSSWEKVALPDAQDTLGRIALAVSPVAPHYLYAAVEMDTTTLYRSEDRGESWEAVSTDPVVGERPFYFAKLVADPVDSAQLYKPGFRLNVSRNAGASWTSPSITGGRYHGDVHDVWVDPQNQNFVYIATDGGVYKSVDKANSWTHMRNLPVSQFYHVASDRRKPYWVYGGLQDNGSWTGPSESVGGISNSDWQSIGFGDGFVMLPDPTDENILYWESQGGNIMRYYRNTGERKSIKPYTESDEPLRFNWDTPIYFGHGESPALYVGAQYLFRSRDRGDTWERISPDLTTNNPELQRQEESGGLTIDNSTAENHTTIVTIAESPHDNRVLWVGTDDGHLQLTRDGGKTWTNLSDRLPGVDRLTWVSSIEPSRADPATAYVTLDGHRHGDMQPYVFRTTDYGESWESIAADNIESYAHIIREDPVQPLLLFLGTEMGLYLSVDGGEVWTRFDGNVPRVPVYDMHVHPDAQDLIIGTHGRGIMIVDDIGPLRQVTPELLQQDVAFLDNRPFVLRNPGGVQRFPGDDEFSGQNPSGAAVITYYLKKRHLFGEMKIRVLNEAGEEIAELAAGKRKGINRVVWTVRRKAPRVPRSKSLASQALFGPTLDPGIYHVELIKKTDTFHHSLQLIEARDGPHDAEARAVNRAAVNRAYELLEELAYIDRNLVQIGKQATAKADSARSRKLAGQLRDLSSRIDARRETLVATSINRISGQVRLRERLAEVYGNMSNYRGRPTQQQLESLDRYEAEIRETALFLQQILGDDLPGINRQLDRAGIAPIQRVSREEFAEM